MASNKRKKVGAAWLKTTAEDGKKFISVVINGGLGPDINLTIWTNSFKKEDSKQPDYIVYLSEPPVARAQAERESSGEPAKSDFPEPEAGAEGDGIPF